MFFTKKYKRMLEELRSEAALERVRRDEQFRQLGILVEHYGGLTVSTNTRITPNKLELTESE